MACRSAYVTKRIGGFFLALSLCQLLVCEMSGLVHLSIPVPFDLAELHSEGGKFLLLQFAVSSETSTDREG